MEPPFGLDQSLTSTDDRLNETPFLIKKGVAEAHLSKSLQDLDQKTNRLTDRANCFLLQRSKMGAVLMKRWGWLLNFCARFTRDIIMEPPFKNSCIHHWFQQTFEFLRWVCYLLCRISTKMFEKTGVQWDNSYSFFFFFFFFFFFWSAYYHFLSEGGSSDPHDPPRSAPESNRVSSVIGSLG